jgi:hypothetical protein
MGKIFDYIYQKITELDRLLNRVIIGLFITIVVITIIKGIRLNIKGKAESLNYQFDGIVDSVSYDIKGGATVVIKGSHYYLGGTSWSFDRNEIQKGDSIFKKRYLMTIKLIKRDGRVIFRGREQ